MEKVWLKHYDDGVPAEIDADQYESLVDLFDQSCRQFADKTALMNMGSNMSYQELAEKSQAFANYLQHELGLKKGDRLAVMMPNCMQYPVVIFGALKAGVIVVNVNPLYTPDELTHQLNDAKVDVLVVLANFAFTVEKALPNIDVKNIIVSELGDCFSFVKGKIVNFVLRRVKKMVPEFNITNHLSFKTVLQQGASMPFTPVPMTNLDTAFLQYTGGTTGVAKGAVLSHRNILANIEQAGSWVAEGFKKGEEIFITPLPLYHIFSLTANCFFPVKMGAKNVLITNPRDIKRFTAEIKDIPFTFISGVNTLFNALLNHKPFREIDFSHLKIALGGGMAVQKDVANRWKDLTGHLLLQAYGLTEASPAVTINRMSLKEFNGSIGLPLPSTEVSIRDSDGNELGLNEPGELCVRGPQVMSGYWNKPEETEKTFFPDNWLRTGDMATVDETGLVRIVDRIKDMILVSGFNVYPNEVEEVIAEHPGVLEVGVVGAPHKDGGEVVAAYIVKKDPDLSKESVMHHCRQKLTAYKVPKRIYFIDELPKTNVGKILRRALREQKNVS